MFVTSNTRDGAYMVAKYTINGVILKVISGMQTLSLIARRQKFHEAQQNFLNMFQWPIGCRLMDQPGPTMDVS